MNVIQIKNGDMIISGESRGLWLNRSDFFKADGLYEYEVQIIVIGYNRLEEATKLCIDSIIKYTTGVDYQLVLVDSGSSDGTLEYFESLEYKNKQIIHIEKNVGLAHALNLAWKCSNARFSAFVANDCIVTSHWLDNMLICMKSDEKIGMVCPAASNVSNNQMIDIGYYDTWDEMQSLAKKHNISNPDLWEERPRLVNPVALYRTELFDIIGMNDVGFKHSFMEDDYARRIHRSGYKMILCKDTYVVHNHPIESRDPDAVRTSNEVGRQCFFEKYNGIDPWDDINNYVFADLEQISFDNDVTDECVVLGIEVRTGTPFFDIRNALHKKGIQNIRLEAYTCDVKYVTDLMAYPANVKIGEFSYVTEAFDRESFDIVVTSKDYSDSELFFSVTDDMFSLVKKGGYMVFPIINRVDIMYYARRFVRDHGKVEKESIREITIEKVIDHFEKNGASEVHINSNQHSEQLFNSVRDRMGIVIESLKDSEFTLDELMIQNYWILVKK